MTNALGKMEPACATQPEDTEACEVIHACTAGLPSDAEVERVLRSVAIVLDGPREAEMLDALAEPDRAKPSKPASPSLRMTVGALVTAHTGEATVGPRALAAYRVGPVQATFGFASTTNASGGADAIRRVRAGLGVAAFAPFSADYIGVAVETGIEQEERYRRAEVLAYVQGSVILQLPLRSLRPYLAMSLGAVPTAPLMMGGVETGVAFPVL